MDYPNHMFLADAGEVKLWFWLIVAVFFLIKKVIEHFTSANEEETDNMEQERREQEERRVRDIIEGMKKTPTVDTSLPPSAKVTARRLPQQTAPTAIQRPQPPPAPRQWQTPATEPTQTLEHYMQAAEQARQAVNSLSDAEQAALQRLHTQPTQHATAAYPSVTAPKLGSIKHSLRSADALRAAILYREILGHPKALR